MFTMIWFLNVYQCFLIQIYLGACPNNFMFRFCVLHITLHRVYLGWRSYRCTFFKWIEIKCDSQTTPPQQWCPNHPFNRQHRRICHSDSVIEFMIWKFTEFCRVPILGNGIWQIKYSVPSQILSAFCVIICIVWKYVKRMLTYYLLFINSFMWMSVYSSRRQETVLTNHKYVRMLAPGHPCVQLVTSAKHTIRKTGTLLKLATNSVGMFQALLYTTERYFPFNSHESGCERQAVNSHRDLVTWSTCNVLQSYSWY